MFCFPISFTNWAALYIFIRRRGSGVSWVDGGTAWVETAGVFLPAVHLMPRADALPFSVEYHCDTLAVVTYWYIRYVCSHLFVL